VTTSCITVARISICLSPSAAQCRIECANRVGFGWNVMCWGAGVSAWLWSCSTMGRLGGSQEGPSNSAARPMFRVHYRKLMDDCGQSKDSLSFVPPLPDYLSYCCCQCGHTQKLKVWQVWNTWLITWEWTEGQSAFTASFVHSPTT
jgi:hypothetical protein